MIYQGSKERKVMQKSDRTQAEVATEGLYTLRNGKYYEWRSKHNG